MLQAATANQHNLSEETWRLEEGWEITILDVPVAVALQEAVQKAAGCCCVEGTWKMYVGERRVST